jgi:hypothetical protein
VIFTFDMSGFVSELDRRIEELQVLLEPQVMEELLRRVVMDTVIKEVSTRFRERMRIGAQMEVDSTPARNDRYTTRLRARIRVLEGNLAGSKDSKSRQVELDQLARMKERLVAQTPGKTGPIRHSVGGTFWSAMEKVAAALGASHDVIVNRTAEGLLAEIGAAPELASIDTPSATPGRAGHPTTSQFHNMWRQLEFGTGVYSSLKSKMLSKFNYLNEHQMHQLGQKAKKKKGFSVSTGTRQWWYGQFAERAIILRGSRGMHVLRDRMGNVYPEDMMRVTAELGKWLSQALRLR